MSAPFPERDPCPDRILEDVGGAFALGAIGGSIFHLVKGAYNSPSGARIAGAMQAVRMNAPRIGGSVAVWGGVFSVFSCTAVSVRQKEDPWNSVIAGAATHGSLNLRRGLRAGARRAVMGGCLLAFLEGFGIVVTHVFDEAEQVRRNLPPLNVDPNLAAAAAAGGGGFQRSVQRPPHPPLSHDEVATLIFGEKVEE